MAVEFEELRAVFSPYVDYTKIVNYRTKRKSGRIWRSEGFCDGGIWGDYASLPQEAKPRSGSSQRPLTTSVCLENTLICLSPLQYRIVLSADANFQYSPPGEPDQ